MGQEVVVLLSIVAEVEVLQPFVAV